MYFQGFMFVNLVFFLCLLLSISRPEEAEPTVMTAIVNTLAILHDIIFLIYVNDAYVVKFKYWGNWVQFSFIMAVFNLIARLATNFLIYLDIQTLSK